MFLRAFLRKRQSDREKEGRNLGASTDATETDRMNEKAHDVDRGDGHGFDRQQTGGIAETAPKREGEREGEREKGRKGNMFCLGQQLLFRA